MWSTPQSKLAQPEASRTEAIQINQKTEAGLDTRNQSGFPMKINAVAICCDQNYLPISCFLADQIANQNPDRNFDILIAAPTKMTLPGQLCEKGVEFVELDTGAVLAKMKSSHLPHSTYLRLWLPDALGDRYQRVLYLDADMFIEGGSLSELFEVNLHGRPMAAVRDMQQWLRPTKHIKDFRAAGLPPAPYFNGGLELFDTRKYRADGILEACLRYGTARPDTLFHHDQSLLNIVLHRNWTEISPLWNWQYASKRPLFGVSQPIRISHLAGSFKPWDDCIGECPPRYWVSMQPYIARHFPDWTLIGAMTPHGNLRQGRLLLNELEHFLISPRINRYVSRFSSALQSFPVD
jgi:hypothetical protein